MQGNEFEYRLRQDLPRGHAQQPKSSGRERPLFARWLTPEEMTGPQWSPSGGILLGRRLGSLIGWNDDRHMLTIAGSRAGKGVSLIIPNLLTYEGSMLVIDPKGENAAITARRRREMGQNVYVLDPFGVSGQPQSAFNPLAEIDLESPDCVEEDPARRNLVTVRRLLMLTDEKIEDKLFQHPPSLGKILPQEALMQILKEQMGPHREICLGVAGHLEGMGENGNERGAVLSTAKTQTQWLDDPRMQQILSRSDFRMADLKQRKTTIYLCLPSMRMGTHARWLRLIIMLALSVMERTLAKPGLPVLFVLDEFSVLGRMQSIETAAGLMAGFGVKLWVILQNIGQLKRHYAHSWETFVANSGALTAFGVVDNESLQVLSNKLGRMRMTEQVATGAVGQALLSGAASFRDEYYDVPLLAEHEIGRIFGREEKRILILGAGCLPAVAERVLYYEDPIFSGLYDEAAA